MISHCGKGEACRGAGTPRRRALKQLEAGRKAEDVAREVGVSKHTICVWCIEKKIELVHIQPGRPMQNGQVESFTANCATNACA